MSTSALLVAGVLALPVVGLPAVAEAAPAVAAAPIAGPAAVQAPGSTSVTLKKRRSAKGVLRVVVKGLQPGQSANVVVKGRGYKKKITRTTTLRGLKAGKYRIIVKPVGVGQKSVFTADVPAGGKAKAKVKYSFTASDPVASADPAGEQVRTPPTASEKAVLDLTNQMRSTSQNCGTEGVKPAVPALSMSEVLTTSARLHSEDMATRDFFDHDNPDGQDPGVRIAAVGYQAAQWGENIAAGQTTPQQVVREWMASDHHCANIMEPGFTELGVGYAEGPGQYTEYWTQNFGRPR